MIQKTSSAYPTPESISNGCAACPDNLPDFYDQQAAQTEWTALAPLISHSPVVRVSRDGGKTYPHKWVRQLNPDSLLPMPAAVHLHDKHGCGYVLVLDLDQSGGNVVEDYTALARVLDDKGALWFADVSPSGGRHIYLPLNEAVAHSELAEVAHRLSTVYPSIDPNPHHSADTGCIRPPGSVWKRGGYQRLITDLKEAIAAATLRNPNTIVDGLTNGIPIQPLPSVDTPSDVDISTYIPETTNQVSPRIARMARTGIYDTNRYSSPSEARQAVITASARVGLPLKEIIRRVETGMWPGLAAMYQRYKKDQRKALIRDWEKAKTWLNQRPDDSVQSSTTSPKVTGGRLPLPSIHSTLRRLEVHLTHTEPPPDTSYGRKRRYVLRALIAAAHQDSSLTISRGCRSLAVASGIDHSKIPEILQALCCEAAPLLRKNREAQGKNAAVYELLPPPMASDASPWSKGKPVQSLRPAFRVLGFTAADVYETLELTPCLTGRAIARKTGHSPTTVLDALALLTSYGLVSKSAESGHTVWEVTAAQRLVDVAELTGASSAVAAIVVRYRNERLLWWAWLAERAVRRQIEYIREEDIHSPLWPPAGTAA